MGGQRAALLVVEDESSAVSFVLCFKGVRNFELNSSQDETRPICNRCQRCGFECDGAKGITFVEGTIVKSRRTIKRAPESTAYEVEDTDSAERQVPPSPSLRGHEFDLSICYSRKYLRRGAAIDLAMQKMQLSDITTAGMATENGHIFPPAILSFGVIIFGAQHGQAHLTDRGYAIHGKALKQLNQALSDGKCYTRDEVILSVATLAILECAVPTGARNYLKHMIGLQRLLELRDPRSFCSRESCELYKSVRHMILFASLTTGKASILARPEWKTVLRASCSEEEMQEQDLFDALADCTVLIADRDNMLSTWDLDHERSTYWRDKIKRRALNLLIDLRTWRKGWDGDERNSYFETSLALARLEPTQDSSEDDSPPSLAVFEFLNEYTVVMLMFYNATLIYVLRVLASLPFENLDIPSNQSSTRETLQNAECVDDLWQLTKDDYIAAEQLAALEVCRCLPYYSARKSRSDSDTSPVIHWAVPTAWATLRSNETAEGKRMMDLLNTKSRQVIAKGLWID